MRKTKRLRTIDWVVGGFAYSADKKAVSSLHLGLYEGAIELCRVAVSIP
jgi:ATP-dependent DNA ligase